MSTILEEAAAGRATLVPWTVEQYHKAIAAGLLAEDTSLELLDGFILRKDRATAGDDPRTIGDRHRMAVLRLAQLAPHFEPFGGFLQTQQPITLPPSSEPEPDAAVVRGQIDDYAEGAPEAQHVWCVIEVADSSISLDLGPKLRAYASARIPQYVVVDLVNDRVLVHEEAAGNTFGRVITLRRGETLQVAAGSGSVPVPVDRLLS